VNARITEIEQEMAANTARIAEIEAMMAAPSHYRDSRNVIAVNREYATLKEKVARLTAEWEGLMSEAERIDADYRKRREELAGQQL
jgi:predicted  nucleic acid-binding Zn-ribbon protein